MRTLVLVGIIVPHLYCIIFADERWPFSHYPMYAPLQAEVSTSHSITGYSDNQTVDLTKREFWGVSWGTLKGAIRSSIRRSKQTQKSPDSTAAAILAEYERRRVLGLHDGPRIVRVKIETRHWNIESREALESAPEITLHADSDRVLTADGIRG